MAEIPPASPHRVAQVDLTAIASNVTRVREKLPPETRLMAVVKAGGYGHGALAVAKAALAGGAWGLAVATLEEAADLVDVCPPGRLLVMGGLLPDDASAAANVKAMVNCYSRQFAEALAAVADPSSPVDVHLKVDTGMGRLGCRPEEAADLARVIAASRGLRLAGTWTHFACAESDEQFTRRQFDLFMHVLDEMTQAGIAPGLRHACNSAAALRYPEMALDGVRCGIAVYGCEAPGLTPALSLRTVITHLKTVRNGDSVGYGATWRAEEETAVATCALGYADGVSRVRSNRGYALIRGRRAPLVGLVSMDAITLDVSGVPDVAVGDVVTLIGNDGAEELKAEDVAGWSETISYEVLTSIGPRVVRRYVE